MRRVVVGVMGCGRIAPAYISNLTTAFGKVVEVRACADVLPEAAKARAEEFGVPRACTPEEMLSDPEIELVVNLTVPAAHYAVNIACLEAGKHVFAEKPLAVTREEGRHILETAAARGLQFGGAADTFLGAGLQACRKVIDEGRLGTPLTAQAMIAMGVQSQRYHTVGIGPMFDMGPYYLTAINFLLGPVVRATGSTYKPFAEKTDPNTGTVYTVEIPTVVSGVLNLANGCLASVTTTTEVFNYFPRLEVYGSEGVLICNDPNVYAGSSPMTVTPKGGKPEELSLEGGFREKGRGLGVAEMALAIAEGRAPRASGTLMYHVLDQMHAFHDASETGTHVSIESTCERPEPFDYASIADA